MTSKHFEWLAGFIAEQYPPKQANCRDEVITMALEFGHEFSKHFSEDRFFRRLHELDREYQGTDGSQA